MAESNRPAHESAAIFDASPFGKIEATGPDACAFLQHICMRNMERSKGSAIYTATLNERGTCESDLTAHRIDAVKSAAPDMKIQVTTESAGQYGVAEQLDLLETLKPEAASISIREIARAPELISRVYRAAARHETQVQHILYGASCIALLKQWLATDLVPRKMRDTILVLGQYEPARSGDPRELGALLDVAQALARLKTALNALNDELAA